MNYRAQAEEQPWSCGKFPTGANDGKALRHYIGKAHEIFVRVGQRTGKPRLKKVMQLANLPFVLLEH